MTYDELKQAVQDYLETSETTFVNTIPMFVKAVENRVYNEVQLPALRKNATGKATVNYRYLTLPIDFLSAYSIAVIDPDTQEYTYLLDKDVNLIREMYPNPTVTDRPKVYGIFSTTSAIFGPTPDKNYDVELHYFYYPVSIVDAGTSWIGTNYSSVLLYGVIAEGYRFLKGDAAQQQTYDAQYDRALGLLRKLGEGRLRDDAYLASTPKTKANVGE